MISPVLWFYLLVVSITLFHVVDGVPVGNSPYTLRLDTSPSDCRGGERCYVPAAVSVVLRSTGALAYGFDGFVQASLFKTPTGKEKLYEGSCSATFCDPPVLGSVIEPFSADAIASFTTLFFRDAGDGYQLTLVGKASDGTIFSVMRSDEFSVLVGDPHALQIQRQPSGAYGGVPFQIQPTLIITDRGGNQITDENGGIVTVSLSSSPYSDGQLYATDESILTDGIQMINSVAEFDGLYLNRIGNGYRLTFSLSNYLYPLTVVNLISVPFTVAISHPNKLEFDPLTLVSLTPKYAGEFFPQSPILKLYDVGGNLITTDTTSAVRVSLNRNPANATLGLAETTGIDSPVGMTFTHRDADLNNNLVAFSESGVFRFNRLRISDAGVNYKLTFELFLYSPESNTFQAANVKLVSEPFSVLQGVPRHIILRQPASDAWAGLQAFGRQPLLEVATNCHSLVFADSFSNLIIRMTSSLAAGYQYGMKPQIIVDTSNSDPVKFTSLSIQLDSTANSLTAGDNIEFHLHTDYNVSALPVYSDDNSLDNWCSYTFSNGNEQMERCHTSYLLLNTFTPKRCYLVYNPYPTKELIFRCNIRENDLYAGYQGDLLLLSANSLIHPDGVMLLDTANRNVDIDLSSLTALSSVKFDFAPPNIVQIQTNVTGVVAPGEVVKVSVEYDASVITSGQIILISNLDPTAASSYWYYNGDLKSTTIPPTPDYVPVAVATLVEVSDSASCENCVLDFVYFVEDITTTSSTFRPITLMTIDIVKQVTTMTERLGRDGNVQQVGVTSEEMEPGFLRRFSLHPSLRDLFNSEYGVPVPLALPSTPLTISIDSTPAILDSTYGLKIESPLSVTHLYPGETLRLSVQFTRPVFVQGNTVALRLAITSHQPNRASSIYPAYLPPLGLARYVETSADNQILYFEYIVENFMTATEVVLDGVDAFMQSTDGSSLVFVQSTIPTLPADVSTASFVGLPAVSSPTLGAAVSRIEDIQVTSTHTSPILPGTVVTLQVRFTTPITCTCPTPVLVVSHHFRGMAVYTSGMDTDTWQFEYTVQRGDWSVDGLRVDAKQPLCGSDTGCLERKLGTITSDCQFLVHSSAPQMPLWNIPPSNVDLKQVDELELSTGAISSRQVILLHTQPIQPVNPAQLTKILKITSENTSPPPPSLIPGEEVYAPGSVIIFSVYFTDRIYLTSSPAFYPRLLLSNGQHATYLDGSFSSTLRFRYVTSLTDTGLLTAGTVLSCPPVNDASLPGMPLPYQHCPIENFAAEVADTEITAAMWIAPSPALLLDPTPPVILSATLEETPTEAVHGGGDPTQMIFSEYSSYATPGDYGTVDSFSVRLAVDKPVVVTGARAKLSLQMNVNGVTRQVYAWYDSERSSSLELVFTAKFRYEGVFIRDTLAWLEDEIDVNGGLSHFYAHSQRPALSMDLRLPSLTVPTVFSDITDELHVPKITRVYKPDGTATINCIDYVSSNTYCEYDPGRSFTIRNQFSLQSITTSSSTPSYQYAELSTLSTLPRYDEALLGSRTYLAGDEIYIFIEFDEAVTVWGEISLGLDVSSRVAYAKYVGFYPEDDSTYEFSGMSGVFYVIRENDFTPSPPTKLLVFKYVVEFGDMTINLEYTDSGALRLGRTSLGGLADIKKYTKRPSQWSPRVDMTLPLPGTVGTSLSGDGLRAKVDGRVPRIVALDFTTASGVYGVTDIIQFVVRMSHPVIVENGIPSILLNAGTSLIPSNLYNPEISSDIQHFRAEAIYISGSGTKELLFEYHPSPGHKTSALDYFADSVKYWSSVDSFHMNGATISPLSANPSNQVNIHLNPAGGFLMGSDVITAVDGVIELEDVSISHIGQDYELIYELSPSINAMPTSFSQVITGFNGINGVVPANYPVISALDDVVYTTSQMIQVDFSSETFLRPSVALRNQTIGRKVAMDGTLAVLGAPNFNQSVTSIQVVKINVESGSPQREIQSFGTFASPRPGIIQFHTTAAVDATVGGTFAIRYGSYSVTSQIGAGADAYLIKSILYFEIPVLGDVTVTVEPYIFCACHNAFIFTLEFNDVQEGPLETFVIDGSRLTGDGVSVIQPTVLQSPALIDGSFRIALEDDQWSTPLDYNSTPDDISNALALLGYPVFEVTSFRSSPSESYVWTVTFDAHESLYDVPLIKTDANGLSGADEITMFTTAVRNGRHGPNGISGTFQLQFRTATTTHLTISSTADEVKEALEALPSINEVNVRRNLFNDEMITYMWTIELISINIFDEYGFRLQDPMTNIEPFQPINHILASGPDISIEAIYNLDTPVNGYSFARRGSYGEGAGAVFVYEYLENAWVETVQLKPSDSREMDRFGSAVAVNKNRVAVGAIGASRNGQREVQRITCSAVSGHFRISFRGWTTGLLPYSVTQQELYDAILSKSNELKKLYTVTAILLSDYSGGLCENNMVDITFISPTTSASNIGVDTGPDLELIDLEDVDLIAPSGGSVVLTVEEIQKGTSQISGNSPDLQNIGAVFVFSTNDCTPITSPLICRRENWIQEARLFPTEVLHNTGYGSTVAIYGDTLVVGAPETSNQSGAMYIYQFNTATSTWERIQYVIDPSESSDSSENRFAETVALYENTLAVSAPGQDDGMGVVHVYLKYVGSPVFSHTQRVFAAAMNTPINSLFGASLSIHKNTLVVGLPAYLQSTPDVMFPSYLRGLSQNPTPSTASGVTSASSGGEGTIGGAATTSSSGGVNRGQSLVLSEAGSIGAVYVYGRSNFGDLFYFQQRLRPSNVKAFDRFGYSVATHDNVVVVSSYGAESGGSAVDSVAAVSSTGVTTMHQPVVEVLLGAPLLTAPNRVAPTGSFRLYWKSRNATQLYEESLRTSRISALRSTITALNTTSSAALAGASSALSSMSREERFFNYSAAISENFSRKESYLYSTREIPIDATASEMRRILEKDLHTGPLRVWRSPPSLLDGGYRWKVTFLSPEIHHDEYEVWGQNENTVELFEMDTKNLFGTNVTLNVSWVNAPPLPLRGMGFVFLRDDADGTFTEQLHLSPSHHQSLDRFGVSVAVNKDFALIGAPNRDIRPVGLNAGGGFMFSLKPLYFTLGLPNSPSIVKEGSNVQLGVTFDTLQDPNLINQDVRLWVSTIDRNAPKEMQTFYRQRYGVLTSDIPYPLTVMEYLRVSGTAHARNQSYGNTPKDFTLDSMISDGLKQEAYRWVDGVYDYRGLADYTGIKQAILFTPDNAALRDINLPTVMIETNADTIIEYPNERIAVHAHAPGFIPSVLGNLYTNVIITDDIREGSSLYKNQEVYAKILDDGSKQWIAKDETEQNVNDQDITGAEMGKAVLINEELGIMFVASPSATVQSLRHAGKVFQYNRQSVPAGGSFDATGRWTHPTNSMAPSPSALFLSPSPREEGNYGTKIAFQYYPRISTAILAISEPTFSTVHIYTSAGTNFLQLSFSYTTTLTPVGEMYVDAASSYSGFASHEFGTSLLFYSNWLLIGSPGSESVYLYSRQYSTVTSQFKWNLKKVLYSSEYDYDSILGADILHRQRFGTSLAASVKTRSLAISAPHANYGNLGYQTLRENYQTEGWTISNFGEGRVYMFGANPGIREVCIHSPRRLAYGEFILSYEANVELGVSPRVETSPLPIYAGSAEVQAALNALESIEDVSVSTQFRQGESSATALREGLHRITTTDEAAVSYCWSITFLWEMESIGTLTVSTSDSTCLTCQPMSSTGIVTSVTNIAEPQDLYEFTSIGAPDARSGDRFGAAIALDGDQLVVGAPYSAATATTNWDFELGSLVGWAKTGTAFDFQPTFGDNSRYRPAISSSGLDTSSSRYRYRSSNLQGRYYLSSFELRPGNPENFLSPHPDYAPGNTQSNSLTGTLTSDVFLIEGKQIRFLLGGGCDVNSVYVELLIDGIGVDRRTGRCEEGLRKESFDVNPFNGRAATIRIVDNSTSDPWGHISVDGFTFDWDLASGASLDIDSSSTGRSSSSDNKARIHGGKVVTPHAGAAYVYRLLNTTRGPTGHHRDCGSVYIRDCTWSFERKLFASDLRGGMQFGSTVAINSTTGLITIGAINAERTGPTKLDVIDAPAISTATSSPLLSGSSFPLPSSYRTLLESAPRYARDNLVAGLWTLIAHSGVTTIKAYHKGVGAVYLYTREKAIYGYTGEFVRSQSWPVIESAKIQPSVESEPQLSFGGALSTSASAMIVGAPNMPVFGNDSVGGAFYYHTDFAAVRFAQPLYSFLEGYENEAVVYVYRNLEVSRGPVTLEYATSDITARGISPQHYAYCMSIDPSRRALKSCGDYMQSAGQIHFPANAAAAAIRLNIVDDSCYERYSKYLQLTLSIPGAGAIQGEGFRALVRIDDDDLHSTLSCAPE